MAHMLDLAFLKANNKGTHLLVWVHGASFLGGCSCGIVLEGNREKSSWYRCLTVFFFFFFFFFFFGLYK